MENQLVVINAQDFGLEKTEAQKIESVFTPMLDKMVVLEKEYNEVIALDLNPTTIQKARELRLKYVKVRTGTDEIHKKAKAYYLAGGRFVDAWKNAQKFSVIGKETELEKIEKHFELIEQAKKEEKNAKRITELSPYVEDVAMFNLKEMSEDGFQQLLKTSRAVIEAQKKAEKEAEDARIKKEKEDAKEQERIRKENEKLKKEAEDRDAKEAEAQKQRDIKQKQIETQQKKDREEKEKLEAKLKAKDDEDKRLKKEAEDREKKAKMAPDKDKILVFSNAIASVSVPRCNSKEAQKILEQGEDEIRIACRKMCEEIEKI